MRRWRDLSWAMFRCPYGAFGGYSIRSLCADDDDSVAPTGLGSFFAWASQDCVAGATCPGLISVAPTGRECRCPIALGSAAADRIIVDVEGHEDHFEGCADCYRCAE